MNINAAKLELMQQLLETDSVALIEKIKKLIEEETHSVPLSKEHKKILDQRLANHKANPESGSPWKDVKKRIKAKL